MNNQTFSSSKGRKTKRRGQNKKKISNKGSSLQEILKDESKWTKSSPDPPAMANTRATKARAAMRESEREILVENGKTMDKDQEMERCRWCLWVICGSPQGLLIASHTEQFSACRSAYLRPPLPLTFGCCLLMVTSDMMELRGDPKYDLCPAVLVSLPSPYAHSGIIM